MFVLSRKSHCRGSLIPAWGRATRTALLAVALLSSASLAFVIVQVTRPAAGTAPSLRLGLPGPTLQDPLGSGEQQTTLAAASTALGASIVLPSTSSVQASDAGAIWQITGSSGTMIAVTFPSQGLMVEYRRPVPYSDPSTEYQGLTQSVASSQVINLNGTPAFLIPQNSDSTGANFGVVLFEVNGTEVRVMGHNNNATLEAIAQSILDRA
jgi:hypothetical protein